MDPKIFTALPTPLLVGNASLMVMLMTRNGNLADRVRSATHQICTQSQDLPPLRRQNLLEQIDHFYRRYQYNQFALGCLAFALICFQIINVLAGHYNYKGAEACFYLGLAFLCFGFLLAGVDIAYGMGTLDLEVSYAYGTYLPSDTKNDTENDIKSAVHGEIGTDSINSKNSKNIENGKRGALLRPDPDPETMRLIVVEWMQSNPRWATAVREALEKEKK